ncbi:MAG TPA: hypothetical protein VK061_00280 [Bacillota bacterium]|nr:hypothetical protein [Bacillota bacterium]
MKTKEREIKYLMKKIEQHEEAISQLMLIIAETNRKLANSSTIYGKSSKVSK